MTLDIRKGKYRFQQGGFTDKENNTFAPFEPKHKVRVGGFMTLMTICIIRIVPKMPAIAFRGVVSNYISGEPNR